MPDVQEMQWRLLKAKVDNAARSRIEKVRIIQLSTRKSYVVNAVSNSSLYWGSREYHDPYRCPKALRVTPFCRHAFPYLPHYCVYPSHLRAIGGPSLLIIVTLK